MKCEGRHERGCLYLGSGKRKLTTLNEQRQKNLSTSACYCGQVSSHLARRWYPRRSSLSMEREGESPNLFVQGHNSVWPSANSNLEVQMHEALVVHELEGVQHLLQNFDGFKLGKRVSIDTSE